MTEGAVVLTNLTYEYDPELFSKWDHANVVPVDDVDDYYRNTPCWAQLYLTDGVIMRYGPYKNYKEASDVVDKIVDDNVNTKFPYLKEPLKAENVNIDGAINLMSGVMRQTKEVYIGQIRSLRKLGKPLPTSIKEYVDSGIGKNTLEELKKENEIIKRLRERLLEAETQEEFLDINDQIAKHDHKITKLNNGLGILNTIKFVERGALGSIDVLSDDISGVDILKAWKEEALNVKPAKPENRGRKPRNSKG